MNLCKHGLLFWPPGSCCPVKVSTCLPPQRVPLHLDMDIGVSFWRRVPSYEPIKYIKVRWTYESGCCTPTRPPPT
jgi:hypothetical protein